MGMVERVAREICKNAGHVTDRHWQHYTNAARAAIEAMREPTEEMIDAGIEAKMKLYERLEAEGKNTRIIVVANHPAGTIYEAMIDKAIQESGE